MRARSGTVDLRVRVPPGTFAVPLQLTLTAPELRRVQSILDTDRFQSSQVLAGVGIGARRKDGAEVRGRLGKTKAALTFGLVPRGRPKTVLRWNNARGEYERVRSARAEPLTSKGFVDAVLEATAGRGVDVVLELVGGVNFVDDVAALAAKGRIVVVSAAGGATAEIPLLQLMQKRGAVHGTVLRSRPLEEKAAAIRAFEREVLPFLESGRVRPVIDSVFPATQAGRAFDRIEERGKVGKVLLDLEK